MNDLTLPPSFGPLSSVLAGSVEANSELSSGIGQSFGVVTYRGKVWAVKFQGNETKLMRDDGDGPRNSIEVIIVRASEAVSKIWYETGYVDGSTAPPDCWSTDGLKPDPAAPKKQSTTCAGCKRNAWGSKVTDVGKQGKECADSKRLAIVPLNDINNEMYNGPMLLRVPAASLKDIGAYAKKLEQYGYPYFGVGTKISFDSNEPYPKFVVTPIRPLTDKEAQRVLELRNDDTVKRILNTAVENVTHEPAQSVEEGVFAKALGGAKPAEPAAKPVVKPVVKPKPVETWVEAELEDGTPVMLNEATGEYRPIDPPSDKDEVVGGGAAPTDEDDAAKSTGTNFDALLDTLMKD
jgi:hypothetical protein